MSGKFKISFYGLFLVFTLFHAQTIEAQTSFDGEVKVIGFSQQDLDSDGQPELSIIDCSCETSLDRILVYDGAKDMQFSSEWDSGTDLKNDIWIFDIGADGTANLIVEFKHDDINQIANFYDDVDNDGHVSYQIIEQDVLITESPYYSLQVMVEGDWFNENGQPNLNIHVLLDKHLITSLSNLALAEKYMPHDGNPDWSVEVVDSNNDERIEYFVMKMLASFPETYGVGRFRLLVNPKLEQSTIPNTALFWPYLDFRPNYDSSSRYFENTPFLFVDWENAKISNFVMPGYPFEHGYYVQSLQNIKSSQVNDVDFEMPQAYYDLADNRDRYPDLSIRLFTGNLLNSHQPRWYEIRYSWNLFHTGSLVWDYKIGTMGNPTIESIVNFPEFDLRMVPYEDLPYWATEQEWQLTTFVANEGGNRASSEGIYAWTPWSGADPVSAINPSEEAHQAAEDYLSGVSIQPPYDYYKDIWEGYRGELNFNRPTIPFLYFSPVDQRLHLKGAEYGLLNIGDGFTITYENNDSDDYIEQWRLYEDTELKSQLYVAEDHLIFAGDNKVILKSASIKLSDFETLPPRNHEEWQTLREILPVPSGNISAGDFQEMLNRFDGLEWKVTGADIRDYWESGMGFRFILNLHPGYIVEGGGGPETQNFPPGEYLVTYENSFAVQPLTPPELTLSIAAQPVDLQEDDSIYRVTLTATNQGSENSAELEVVLQAGCGAGSQELVRDVGTILGGDRKNWLATWQPQPGQSCRLAAALFDPSDNRVAQAGMDVEVHGLPGLAENPILRLSELYPALAFLGLLFGVTGWLYYRLGNGPDSTAKEL